MYPDIYTKKIFLLTLAYRRIIFSDFLLYKIQSIPPSGLCIPFLSPWNLTYSVILLFFIINSIILAFSVSFYRTTKLMNGLKPRQFSEDRIRANVVSLSPNKGTAWNSSIKREIIIDSLSLARAHLKTSPFSEPIRDQNAAAVIHFDEAVSEFVISTHIALQPRGSTFSLTSFILRRSPIFIFSTSLCLCYIPITRNNLWALFIHASMNAGPWKHYGYTRFGKCHRLGHWSLWCYFKCRRESSVIIIERNWPPTSVVLWTTYCSSMTRICDPDSEVSARGLF